MTNNYTLDATMTLEDAVKFIKRQRGKSMTLFISCDQRAPIKDDPDHVFPIFGNVEVTARVAVKFIESAYSNFVSRGVLVKIRVLGKCVFIG